MECFFCGQPLRSADRGQYRGIPGEGEGEWAPCHVSCARKQQEQGVQITVRRFPIKR
jgi:hypothetical protein